MALLVTLFLVLVNIFNAITNNSPKADGLNALQVSKKYPFQFPSNVEFLWKSEKFILVLFDDTSSSSKFMNENEENKKTLAKMTFSKDGILKKGAFEAFWPAISNISSLRYLEGVVTSAGSYTYLPLLHIFDT